LAEELTPEVTPLNTWLPLLLISECP